MRRTSNFGILTGTMTAVLGLSTPACKDDNGTGGGGSDGSATGGTGGGGDAARDMGSAGAGGAGGASTDGGGDAAVSKVTVTVNKLGTSMASGTATFEKVGMQIKLTVDITGVMPAGVDHGIHIHQNPNCGDTMDDAGVTVGGAAGGHWNPTGMMHGTLTGAMGHLGDIGNIRVDAMGKGMLVFMTDKWTLGGGAMNDVLNRAIVVHANPDDLMSQPVGNAGGRIACGIIR